MSPRKQGGQEQWEELVPSLIKVHGRWFWGLWLLLAFQRNLDVLEVRLGRKDLACAVDNAGFFGGSAMGCRDGPRGPRSCIGASTPRGGLRRK